MMKYAPVVRGTGERKIVPVAANVVSLIFNPLVYATIYFAFLAAAGAPAGECAISWCLIVLAPTAVLFVGVRVGVWSDLDVTRPRERRTYLPWAALSAAVAAAVALGTPFTYAVRLSVVGIAVWLTASMLVSQFWKVSLHAGGTCGIVGLVWILFGPAAGLAIAWTPFVVAWSRLYLGKHDAGQVAVGFVLGALAIVAVAVAV